MTCPSVSLALDVPASLALDLPAALALGLWQALVYTSTYNVIFGGLEIENGDESISYFPVASHVDAYARSKAVAEQLVLHSNARSFPG